MIFYNYIQINFTNQLEIAIKKKVMNFFLISDFQTTSKFSFSQKGKIFGFLIPNTMNNFILRLLNLNVNLLIFIFISAFIAIKFPTATILSVICATVLIKLQNYFYKPLLSNVSKKVSESSLINNTAFNEALLNIKSVKVSNNEIFFYNNFVKSLILHYNNCKKMNFLNAIPPYIIEPFAIILLFVLLLVISYQNYASPEKLVASFALVAAAIFRITPAISRIQVNYNGVISALPMVEEFIRFYDENNIKDLPEADRKTFVNYNDSIELKNLNFEYETGKTVLKNINLKISKGEFIGIVGLSGVGKTTLVDIIAGLYKPKSGEILTDGKVSAQPLKIGYIPQEFALLSGNIRENVAFGEKDIDDKKVIDSLKKAQLYDFIINNHAEGIYARPFSDSLGFSHGQKQRLAIARALYSNPDILILDEATSSLDLKNEDEICHVLNELKGDKTIIVIAHRLSTIKNADRILYMENGTVVSSGSYNELLERSEGFKTLVKLAYMSDKNETSV
ncbi:ABC transporter ATP-binding protein [bacterium]|nr:ABC transporter ATP-binding protein [bacterium]